MFDSSLAHKDEFEWFMTCNNECLSITFVLSFLQQEIHDCTNR